MEKFVLYNADIMTMNDSRDVLINSFIAVADGKITALGPMNEYLEEDYRDFSKINCGNGYKRQLILPGFIQTHVHTSQALARGLADDIDLQTWTRERIWPYEVALNSEDVYVSSMLSIAEMLKSGTTMFCEAAGQEPDSIGEAIIDSGIKGIISQSTMDIPGQFPDEMHLPTSKAIETNILLYEKWKNKNDRVRACFNLLNLFNTSETIWKELHEYSLKNEVLVQAHIAEAISEVYFTKEKYGFTPLRLVDSWGCLSPYLLAAHMVHLDEEEINLVKLNNVQILHLPAADLRIAGFAPIPRLVKAGVNVSLGVNSPPCNNRMSIMDEMWLASLMHKAYHEDPTAIPAKTVLDMATINGARALRVDKITGSIEIGKQADIVIMELNKLVTTPTHDYASTIVYQATSEIVDTVIVNGRFLVQNRKLLTIDEDMLINKAEKQARAIVKRANIHY